MHKKTRPEFLPDGFFEMEREKRLELTEPQFQNADATSVPHAGKSTDSPADAHVLQPTSLEPVLRLETPASVNSREIAALMQAHPDLLEIAAAWKEMNPAIKEPILAMVRGSRIRMEGSPATTGSGAQVKLVRLFP